MSRPLDDAVQAVARVRDMPFGLARSEVAASLAHDVLAEGPPRALPFALFALVESYVFGHEVEKAYLPFTQAVRTWDEHPELFDEEDVYSLFWSFKWMVGDLMEFPSIPRSQIEATIAEMERRYLLAGHGLSAVRHQQLAWHRMLDDGRVHEAYDAWISAGTDAFSQCPACRTTLHADHLFATRRWTEGIRLVERALDEGESCHTEPATMLAHLQLAMLEVDDPDGAARAHRRLLPLLDTSDAPPAARGRTVQFLARTGNTDAAVRFLERNEASLIAADTPYQRWSFLTTAGVGTAILRRTDRPVRLTDVPVSTLSDLDDWMHAEALVLAERFDARGGTPATLLRTTRAWSGDARMLRVSLDVLPRDLHRTHDGETLDEETAGPAERAGLTGDALVERAEHLASAGHEVDAARAYDAAATAFDSVGETEAAGFARAETAILAERLGDLPGAVTSFRRAYRSLQEVGTRPELAGPVAREYARTCVLLGEHTEALAVLDDCLVSLFGDHEAAARALDALPEDSGDSDVVDLVHRVRRLAIEAGHVLDTRARTHATLGAPDLAIDDARRAAELFAEHNQIADASHAFALAGRLHQEAGRPEDASWLLESAIEGFTITRDRVGRADAAGRLVDVLRTLGRGSEADSLLAGLA